MDQGFLYWFPSFVAATLCGLSDYRRCTVRSVHWDIRYLAEYFDVWDSDTCHCQWSVLPDGLRLQEAGGKLWETSRWEVRGIERNILYRSIQWIWPAKKTFCTDTGIGSKKVQWSKTERICFRWDIECLSCKEISPQTGWHYGTWMDYVCGTGKS